MGYRQAVSRYKPVGYWSLNGPATSLDLSGGGHNATYVQSGASGDHGGPSLLRDELTGRTMCDVSGNAHYTVSSYSALNQSAFSMVMWFQSSYTSDRRMIIGRDDGGSGDSRAFYFAVKAAGNFEFVDNGSSHLLNGTRTDINNGRIHMIGFYYTTNLFEFWCDAKLDTSFSSGVAAPATTSTTTMYLRRHQTAGQNVVGALGHVAYIPGRLMPGDWRYLYEVGMGGFR